MRGHPPQNAAVPSITKLGVSQDFINIGSVGKPFEAHILADFISNNHLFRMVFEQVKQIRRVRSKMDRCPPKGVSNRMRSNSGSQRRISSLSASNRSGSLSRSRSRTPARLRPFDSKVIRGSSEVAAAIDGASKEKTRIALRMLLSLSRKTFSTSPERLVLK